MKNLMIPQHLQPGDKVAAVSLSWGGAGDTQFRHRFDAGKKSLQANFGLQLIAMDNALRGSDFIYHNPQARAADLHQAFSDPSIKGIFSCIGGDDSVRIIDHVDLKIIRNNPKVVMGYSDSTVTNFICFAAGLRSFNGPAILTQFAENGGMHHYTKQSVQTTLLSTTIPGEVKPAPEGWTIEFIDWTDQSQQQARTLEPQTGWTYSQGKQAISGPLIGGCSEVLAMLVGTKVWPAPDVWNGAILFIENSEQAISPDQFSYFLRNLGAQGILQRLSGILFAKPCRVALAKWAEYDQVLVKVTAEYGRSDMPIVTQMDFGHTDPIFVLPIGARATIDPVRKTFSIDEPGCSPRFAGR